MIVSVDLNNPFTKRIQLGTFIKFRAWHSELFLNWYLYVLPLKESSVCSVLRRFTEAPLLVFLSVFVPFAAGRLLMLCVQGELRHRARLRT